MLADMRGRWVKASYVEDKSITAPLAARIFDNRLWRPDRPLRIMMIGTDFEVRVWETLLGIPMGKCSTYSTSPARSAGRRRRARRRRGRQEPDVVRRAVPSRARPLRRHHGLSLGADSQARDAGLGSGPIRCRKPRRELRSVPLPLVGRGGGPSRVARLERSESRDCLPVARPGFRCTQAGLRCYVLNLLPEKRRVAEAAAGHMA